MLVDSNHGIYRELGGGKLQVQPRPQCPVSDGMAQKRRPVVMGQGTKSLRDSLRRWAAYLSTS
jgi:hypothetical protein